MDVTQVADLCRAAAATSDASVMRRAVELLLQRGPESLSAEDEYLARHVVAILELSTDGLMLRDTRYYARPFEPSDYRP